VSYEQLGVPQYMLSEERLSPSKLSAKMLNGTFLPLEVKFKDLSEFEKSAKKKLRSKFPTISPEHFQS
jgi:hypothetical protein